MNEHPNTNGASSTNASKLLIGLSGLASMLGVSKAHIKRLRASGRLPRPIRLGRRTLWRVTEIELWCQAGCPDLARWEREYNRA